MNDGAAITGTIEFAKSDPAVVGSGTSFLTEVNPGDEIYAPSGNNDHVAEIKLKVKSITSDTALTLVEGPGANDSAGFHARLDIFCV